MTFHGDARVDTRDRRVAEKLRGQPSLVVGGIADSDSDEVVGEAEHAVELDDLLHGRHPVLEGFDGGSVLGHDV
jgi:hypothetical protein